MRIYRTVKLGKYYYSIFVSKNKSAALSLPIEPTNIMFGQEAVPNIGFPIVQLSVPALKVFIMIMNTRVMPRHLMNYILYQTRYEEEKKDSSVTLQKIVFNVLRNR